MKTHDHLCLKRWCNEFFFDIEKLCVSAIYHFKNACAYEFACVLESVCKSTGIAIKTKICKRTRFLIKCLLWVSLIAIIGGRLKINCVVISRGNKMYAFWPDKIIYENKYVKLLNKKQGSIFKLCDTSNSKLEFHEGIINKHFRTNTGKHKIVQ